MQDNENKSTIDKIRDLYKSLTDDEKNDLVSELMEDEDLMGRLLGQLLEVNEEADETRISTGTYIDFLRKVRE